MRQVKLSKSITRRSSPSLDIYFREISKIKLLTQEEEVNLVKKIRKGVPLALEQLVNANLRFVVFVAKKYQHRGMSLPDLISEGNLGLIKAIERFDDTKGFKFISYAVWWIRQSINKALANQASMIRIPLNKIKDLNKIRQTSFAFEQENEREPTLEELARAMDFSLEDLCNTINVPGKISSLDERLGDKPDSSTLEEVLENTNARGAEEYIHTYSLKTDITRVLSRLKPRDSTILKMIFGIGSSYEFSLEEIGNKYHITKERVRQIKENAIHKLRGYKKVLDKYADHHNNSLSY